MCAVSSPEITQTSYEVNVFLIEKKLYSSIRYSQEEVWINVCASNVQVWLIKFSLTLQLIQLIQ